MIKVKAFLVAHWFYDCIMSKILASALLAVLLASCAGAHAQAPVSSERAALIAEGRGIAERNCSTCHAIGTSGESRNSEAPPFRTLSENYPVNSLEEAFAEGILVGHPAMPEFRLEPHQIDAIVAYLESIQERRGG